MGKPLSRTLHHDSQQSDLNHVAQDDDALNRELQNKLDLKDVSESEDKGSNLEDGSGKLSDERAAPEGGKGEGSEDDGGGGGDDVVGVVYDDDCNGGDEGSDWIENVNESESDKVGKDVEGVDSRDERSSGRAQLYPLRPEAEDCAYYLRTGSCKFGFNCKFNHPLKRKNQKAKKENAGEKEQAERSGQTECKYYLRSGGCKFGKACKFNHKREKCSSANPIAELNFLGLPIRVGEKECHYYMRTGSCKFGANCKFNHPDPTAGGGDSPSRYDNGSSVSLQGVSQSSISSWSSTRPLNESTPFVPMILSANPGVSPQSSEWDGYQAPVYLPERNMHLPSTYVMNNPVMETNVYMHHQQVQVEEFPERPGEPECSYFLKTGDCKFKSNCRFHHPKNRIARLPPCSLSNKGLPLRPDQNVCTYYSRYGICKFGPACKFDHPPPSTMSGLDQQSSYSNSASVDVAENGGVSDGNQ